MGRNKLKSKKYLIENLSKRGKSIESSEKVDIKNEFVLNLENSKCNKDKDILFMAFVLWL